MGTQVGTVVLPRLLAVEVLLAEPEAVVFRGMTGEAQGNTETGAAGIRVPALAAGFASQGGSVGLLPMSPGWLARYRSGQRGVVWHELRQLGSAVREPGLVEEAQLVCDEMAGRARHNVELIVARLAGAGYQFDIGGATRPHVPPSAGAAQHAAWLEDRFGPVPLALLSWVRLVGDVCLCGTHPEWPGSAGADPLVIEAEGTLYGGSSDSVRSDFEDDYENWQDWTAEYPDVGPFLLPVAPDRFHKQGKSGGTPCGVPLPDAGAEGIFVGEIAMPFVSYLNWVFGSGGFPWPDQYPDGHKVRRALCEDLLPL